LRGGLAEPATPDGIEPFRADSSFFA